MAVDGGVGYGGCGCGWVVRGAAGAGGAGGRGCPWSAAAAGAERRQVAPRAVSLDQLVPAEHRVRQVWAFAEGLDLAPLYARIKAVEGACGHPPADPRLLVALWLWATLDGVGSARELARRCGEHLAYQWLCGGVGVNHKTLGDFRVAHGALLERLLTDGFAALLRAGIASLERVAQDGMRIRAGAGAASFRRRSSLEGCRRAAQARVAQLRAELDATRRRPAGGRPGQGRARQGSGRSGSSGRWPRPRRWGASGRARAALAPPAKSRGPRPPTPRPR